MTSRLAPLILTVCLLLAGCTQAPDPNPSSSGGDRAPTPFHEAMPPLSVEVKGAEGTLIRGYLFRPVVPEGTRVPVVLSSTPYTVDETWTDVGHIPREAIVAAGFAFAAFDVRGTGRSDGCFEWGGAREKLDQRLLVEWAASQPWSNGRVGMIGASYLAATAMMAAVQAPPALRTVVVSGLTSDLYTFLHTPQGAAVGFGGEMMRGFATSVGVEERLRAGGPAASVVCPDLLTPSLIVERGIHTDERDAAFWAERRISDEHPKITAAVLSTHGFQDLWQSGHAKQEDDLWSELPNAPKWILEGQWGHGFPLHNDENNGHEIADWDDQLIAWFAYWLRDEGPRPARLDAVDYMDNEGNWHSSTAWPPAEARVEALRLAEGLLTPAAVAAAPAEFRTKPLESWPDGVVCGDEAGQGTLFLSEPLAATSLLAGNTLAIMNIRASEPGGRFQVSLFDVPEGGGCADGVWQARKLARGAADLRFHGGNLQGRDFPVGTWTRVRVDMDNLAEVLPAGHRLAVLVSAAESFYAGQAFTPTIEVSPESVVFLPFVEGTLGGAPPAGSIPERPFTPKTSAVAIDLPQLP